MIVSTRSNLLFGPTIWTIDKIVRFYELDNLSLIIRSTRKRQLLDIEIPFIGEFERAGALSCARIDHEARKSPY